MARLSLNMVHFNNFLISISYNNEFSHNAVVIDLYISENVNPSYKIVTLT